MADLKKIVEILFTLTDKVTSPLKKTKNTVRSVGSQAKSSATNVDKLDKSLKKTGTSSKVAGNEVRTFGKKTKKASDETKKFHSVIKGVVVGLGSFVVAVTSLVFPIKEAGAFQRKMAMVKAVSGATTTEFVALNKIAKRLGRETRFSAMEAGDGLLFLARAGLKTAEAIEVLPSVLQLAQAGAIGLGEAADISTNIMSAYGKTAGELANINDVLVKTFTSTNSSLSEIGQGFKYVGPIAKGLKADFNDLLASIGMLHNAGLKAEQSGTILRNTLGALFNPTKEEAKLLQDLSRRIGGVGLQIRDSENRFVGFASLIEQLEKGGLRAEEALKLFGMRAGPGIAALMEQGSASLKKLTTELDNAGGTTERISSIMKETLDSSVKAAQSAISGLTITIGEKLIPIATKVLNIFADLINKITDFSEKHETLTKYLIIGSGVVLALVAAIGSLAVVVGTLTLAWIGAVAPIASVISGISSMGGVLATLSLGLIKAKAGIVAFGLATKAALLGPLGIIALAGALGYALGKLFEYYLGTTKVAKEFNKAVEGLRKAGTSFTDEELEKARIKYRETELRTTKELSKTIEELRRLDLEYSKAIIPAYKEQKSELDRIAKARQLSLDIQRKTGALNETEYAKQSIALEVYKYEKRSQLVSDYFDDIKSHYSEDTDEYKSAAKEQQQIAEQLSVSKQVAVKKWAEFHSRQLKDSLSKEKTLLKDIEDINRRKADLELSTEEKLFKIRQRGRTDSEKQVASRKRAYQKLSKAQKELAAGEFDAAKQSAEAAGDLFFSLENNAAAYKGVQKAAKLTGKILDAEGNKAQKALNLQQESTEMLKKSLDSVNESIIRMTVEFQKALGVDSSDAESALKRLEEASKSNFVEQEKSRKSMQELVKTVEKIPIGGFKIKADVTGITEVERLRAEINKLYDKTITIRTRHVEERSGGGMIGRFSSGTKIPGYGGGDKHHALLEGGEVVTRKEAVRYWGSQVFDDLNSLVFPQSILKLASGSSAPSSAPTTSGLMNVNLNLPVSGRSIPTKMSVVNTTELISQLKKLERLGS